MHDRKQRTRFSHSLDDVGALMSGQEALSGDGGEGIEDEHIAIKGVIFGQVAQSPPHFLWFLRDVIACDSDVSGAWAQERGEYFHRRRFAGAVGADQCDDFTLWNVKGNVVDSAYCAVIVGKVRDVDHGVKCALGGGEKKGAMAVHRACSV